MNHFVVRERQDKVLTPGVDQTEREVIVQVASVNRILGEVVERVVHPTHVPLGAETESAEVGRTADSRPRGGLLGHHERPGAAPVDNSLRSRRNATASRFSRPPKALGTHSPGSAAVVEVKHRGYGVDAQPIDVKLRKPVQRAREEEVSHLGASRIEDVRPPIGVLPLPRIEVFVERRTIEASQGECVLREVRRYPIDDNAHAALMKVVDEPSEMVGRAVSARWARSIRSPGSPRIPRRGAPAQVGARRR